LEAILENMNRLIILLFLTTICCNNQTNYDCSGASSPTELSIVNSNNTEIDVYFLDLSEQNEFRIIKRIKLNGNEEKLICFENEGPITKGLYIYRDGRTSKIILKSQQNNIFPLSDTTYKIQTPYQLKKLIK
jgi:hypothetical protein